MPLDVPRIDVKLGKALDQRAEGNLGLEARKRTFPFGPFLAAGALVAVMWGPQLWAGWYGG